MTWIITASGREYHYDHGPQPIVLDDIAHQLALINRFHGSTSRPYSVAEHSMLVADIAKTEGASPAVELAALLHDAHEAYTQDVATPVKAAVNIIGIANQAPPAWLAFENHHANIVRRHYGVHTAFATFGALIHHWDLRALATERRDLTAFNSHRNKPWAVLMDGTPQAIKPLAQVNLNSAARVLTFQSQRDRFMWRVMELQNAIHKQAALLMQPQKDAA